MKLNAINDWLRYHGLGKGALIFIGIILSLVIFLIGNTVHLSIEKNYTDNEEPLFIYITPQSTLYSVGSQLETQELINGDTFRYKVERMTDWDLYVKKVKGGYYTIPENTHIKELLEILGLKVD